MSSFCDVRVLGAKKELSEVISQSVKQNALLSVRWNGLEGGLVDELPIVLCGKFEGVSFWSSRVF